MSFGDLLGGFKGTLGTGGNSANVSAFDNGKVFIAAHDNRFPNIVGQTAVEMRRGCEAALGTAQDQGRGLV